MNKLKKRLILLICFAALGLGSTQLLAQDQAGPSGGAPGRGAPGIRRGGRVNPRATMDKLRAQLAVQDDSRWTAISNEIFSVLEARRAVLEGFGIGPAATRDGSFGSQPKAALFLENSVKDNAPESDIKVALSAVRSAVRDEQKTKEEAYAKAQDDLRALLNARQEAQLTLDGVLQ